LKDIFYCVHRTRGLRANGWNVYS